MAHQRATKKEADRQTFKRTNKLALIRCKVKNKE